MANWPDMILRFIIFYCKKTKNGFGFLSPGKLAQYRTLGHSGDFLISFYWFCLMFVPKFPKCSVSMYVFPAQQIGQDGVWTQTMAHYMHSSLLILALCSQLSNEVWNALSFLCTLLRCLRCDWWHYRISLMLRKHLLIDHNCGVLSTVGEATMFRIPCCQHLLVSSFSWTNQINCKGS